MKTFLFGSKRLPFIAFLLLFVIFLGLADVLILSKQRNMSINEEIKHLNVIVTLAGTLLREPLLSQDYDEVEQFLLQWAAENEEILEIRATMPNGFLLVHYNSAAPQINIFNIQKQVNYLGRDLLTLDVVMDRTHTEMMLDRLQLQLIAASLLMAAIFATLLWVVMRKLAIRPLENEIERRRLAEAELLRSKNDLELAVYKRTKELDASTNNMIQQNLQLLETRDAMLNLVEDLEVEVSEHKNAKDKITNQLEHLNALRSIDIAISSNLDLNITLDVFLEQVMTQLHVDAANVLLLNQDTLTLEHAASKGFWTDQIKQTSLQMGEGYAGYIALEREPINEPSISNISDKCKRVFLIKDEKFKTYFGIPLFIKGAVIGVLEVFHRSYYEPDKEWYSFLDALAGQADIAIDNALMFDEIQSSRDELLLAYETTIEGWARALDYRDKETEGHSRRVTNIAIRIAREMGIPASELSHIRRGALLHDIGKLGVPDNILFKPGALNEKEWDLMREHPLIAYKILSPIPFLRQALDIPYCHHEKLDGSGYPRGLKGDLIPIAARIFAVVDVWDALTSDRPYRSAWSKEKARAHISSISGTHFDPAVVELFLNLEL